MEIDESDLLMWKESPGRFRFQTINSKISRQMKGRKNFHLTASSLNKNFWIYYCDLSSVRAALSRFKGLTGRKPVYTKQEEIYY
jgi:hypothetical protein